jgi:membrane protein
MAIAVGAEKQEDSEKQAESANVVQQIDEPPAGQQWWRRTWRFVRRVQQDMGDDNLTLVAAGVAFYWMLALFPAIIAMVTVYALVADANQAQQQLEPVLSALPQDARNLILPRLAQTVDANDGGLTLGLVASLLATLWATSGGMQALMTGINMIYGVRETRNYLRLKGTALGLTLGALIAAALAIFLVAAFPVLLDWLGLDAVTAVAAQAARWIMLIVLVGTGLSVMYRFGPAPHRARWHWITPGNVTAVALWLAASLGFSVYVSSFGSYNKTYGALAAVIVLLMWLYLSAVVILLGAEIDAIRDESVSATGGRVVVEGESTKGADDRMSTVIESIDVAVPVRTAYNQWTQFEDFPKFMDGVEEIRQVTPEMTHWKVKVAGVEREFDARITEQHPDERVAWTTLDGPKHAGVVTFHRLDESHTRVTVQMDIDPEGVVETVGDKAGVIDRRVKGDVKRFKEFIENRDVETGAWRGDVERPQP